MFVHNASFMMVRERESEFIAWLAPLAGKAGGGRISAMREAAGVDYRHAEAQTVAWQREFDTLDKAREWSAATFATIASRFEMEFGPDAMVFTSIFETIEY